MVASRYINLSQQNTMKLSHPIQLLFLVLLIVSGFWFACRSLTALVLIVGAAATLSSVFTRQVFHVFSLTKLMLIYLTWLFVVAYTSAIPNQSMMILAVLACFPVIYLVASNMSGFVKIWRQLSILLYVTAIGLAAWAIWQVYNHHHAEGPLNDRNAFAALNNLLWFPTAYLFLSTKLSNKVSVKLLLGLGLLVISVALFATSSRGGILSWLLLMPVLLWAAYRQVQSKKLTLVLLLVALTAYVFSAKLLHSDIADRTFKVAPSVQGGHISNYGSESARLMLWQSTINIAKDNPVFGTGWGTFIAYYPAYRQSSEYSTYGEFTHNDYLQLASEGGFIALLLQFSILFMLLLQLRNCLRKKDEANFYAVALLLGVLAIFIQASVNFIFYYAFMNILAGLYLAYVAKTVETPNFLKIHYFQSVRSSVKRLVAAIVVLLIAIPYLVNLIAQLCLNGDLPGMKVLNFVAPKLSTYKLANFITAIYPKEGTAQLVLLEDSSKFLKNNINNNENVNFKNNLLNDTLKRYEYVRKQNNDSPNLALEELELVLAYNQEIDQQSTTGAAYKLAHQILADSLRVDPRHIKSMIVLARLQAIEGNKKAAYGTLQAASTKTHDLLYQQLISVEILRQRAAPNKIPELADIEMLLNKAVLINKLPDEQAILPDNFYENINAALDKINTQLSQHN